MQTDPFLLSNRVHSLKFLRSTTLGSKDIGIRNISLWTICNSFRHSYLTEVLAWNIKSLQRQLAKIIICGEFLVFLCFFYVTYKVIKKAALALVYKPQLKCFQSSCLGLKNIKFSKSSAKFFFTQTTRNKII